MAATTATSIWPSRPSPALLAVVVGFCLLIGHLYSLTIQPDQANHIALANHLFQLMLALGMVWLAGGVGLRVLRLLGLGMRTDLELLIFAVAVGLGLLGYAVLALSLVGWAQRPWLLSLLVCVAFWARRELVEVAQAAVVLDRTFGSWKTRLRDAGLPWQLGSLAGFAFCLMLLRAMAPPTGYDALVYHLAAPKRILELGRLEPMPEVVQANMPLAVSMLYLVPLAAGADEVPGVLHLTSAILLTLATYRFGARFLSPCIGVLAAAGFVGSTALAVYAPIPNIDYAWALFDFMAVFAFSRWAVARRQAWLAVAGLCAGFSIGSKYFGLLTFGAIFVAIAWVAVVHRRKGPRTVFVDLCAFAGPALLVGVPWYLKNWMWLGSPVWPFLASNYPAPQSSYFASHMNTGREVIDYVLAPVRMFTGASSEYPEAWPPVLCLAVPLYVAVRKTRVVNCLLLLAAVHLAVWSQGIQAARYLTPVFPALCIAAAYALDSLCQHRWLGGTMRRLVPIAVTMSVVVVLLRGVLLISYEAPFGQLVGFETRDSYLNRVLGGYDSIRALNARREEVQRVIVIGEARLYYLESLYHLDSQYEVWTALADGRDPDDVGSALMQAGLSHLLVGESHLTWAARFDPERRLQTWRDAFEPSKERFLELQYTGPTSSLYRVTTASAEGSLR